MEHRWQKKRKKIFKGRRIFVLVSVLNLIKTKLHIQFWVASFFPHWPWWHDIPLRLVNESKQTEWLRNIKYGQNIIWLCLLHFLVRVPMALKKPMFHSNNVFAMWIPSLVKLRHQVRQSWKVRCASWTIQAPDALCAESSQQEGIRG